MQLLAAVHADKNSLLSTCVLSVYFNVIGIRHRIRQCLCQPPAFVLFCGPGLRLLMDDAHEIALCQVDIDQVQTPFL